MKPTLPLFLILFFTAVSIYPQSDLYIPVNVKRAYDFGTRSYDGKPGENYWQNHTDYKIDVELDPETRELKGAEDLTYYNGSPDRLSSIVLRLYQDILMKGEPRDFRVDPRDLHDGISITKVMLDSVELGNDRYEKMRGNLIIKIGPDDKIEPGEVTHIRIEWSLILPKYTKIRMGSYYESSFFVGYWYPQISVYDDIEGWDMYNYTGFSEFYNDFNNYEVNITVPQDYVVWGTGVLQNPEEVLSEKYLERYNEAKTADSVVMVITGQDLNEGGFTRGEGKKVWRYKASNVPDFAFAVSREYMWEMSSVLAHPDAKQRTIAATAYHPMEAKYFARVTDVIKKSLRYFSTELPGIQYPYPAFTVFNGHHGMEFPMMADIGSNRSAAFPQTTTTHELAHSYFPFYMGINEHKYAWMEEGWAVMLTYDLDISIDSSFGARYSNNYFLGGMGTDTDAPLMTNSNHLRDLAHGVNAYYKPSVAYFILQDYLGDEEFKKALQEYMWRWNGKHPIPYDFFYTFEDVTGEDLSWLWKPWFFEFGYPDLGIKDVYIDGDEITVTVEKIGSMPVPVHVIVTLENNEQIIKEVDAGIWKDGKTEAFVEIRTAKPARKIELDALLIPDKDPQNNFYTILRNNN